MDIEKIKSSKSIKELLEFSIINIDKPSGPTSFQVSHHVMKYLGLRKTSHLGTLDPMVSGVLPVALNRACRLNEYLMHRDKTYVGIMRLHAEIPLEKLEKAIEKFIGKITQLPPVRSRVKRAERVREIKSFNILEQDGKDILFETQVQAGTYIRKLTHDLGLELGGAHMLELRRTEAGIFKEPSYTLYDFEKASEEYKKGNEEPLRNMLIPGEVVASLLPVINVKQDNLKQLLTGKPIFEKDLAEKPEGLEKGNAATVFCNSRFIGCYRIYLDGDLIAKPEFVLN